MDPQSQTEPRTAARTAADGREPERIQADIQRTRARIDDTLDAVAGQLSPGELISQLLELLRGDGQRLQIGSKAGDALASLGRTIKDNPVPSALIGLGLLGLARDGDSELGGRAKRAAKGVGRKATRAAQAVGDKARELGEELGDNLEDAREGAADMIEGATDKLEDLAGDARETVVLGALGIALGAALGAGLPRTRAEDEAFGELSDELGDELGSQAKHAVQTAAAAVGDELDSARPS